MILKEEKSMSKFKKGIGMVLGLAMAFSLVVVPASVKASTVSDAQAALQEAQKAHNQRIADENKAAVEANNAGKVAAQQAAVDATKKAAEAHKALIAAVAAQNKADVEANNAAKVAAQQAAVDATNQAAEAHKAHIAAVAKANEEAVAARLLAAIPAN